MNLIQYTTSASTTRPVDSAGIQPNSIRAWSFTETASPGGAARVRLMHSALDKPAAVVCAEDVTAGSVTVGNHIVKITYVTKNGETELSAVSNTVAAAGSRRITVTLVPLTGPGSELVIGVNVYMTEAAGATYYKVDSAAVTTPTVSGNSTTSYTINVSDATLVGYASPPTSNASGVVIADHRLAASSSSGLQMLPSGDWVSAYLCRAEILTGAATTYLHGRS